MKLHLRVILIAMFSLTICSCGGYLDESKTRTKSRESSAKDLNSKNQFNLDMASGEKRQSLTQYCFNEGKIARRGRPECKQSDLELGQIFTWGQAQSALGINKDHWTLKIFKITCYVAYARGYDPKGECSSDDTKTEPILGALVTT